jgi:hypothetical protein
VSAVLKDAPPIPPGLYAGESEATYHADRDHVLSCSAIKQLLRSPAHYLAWAQSEIDTGETPAQAFGKAFHCALLEPERFAQVYVTLGEDAPRRPSITQIEAAKPSPATVAAIQFWDGLQRSGRKVLSLADANRIDAMLASVQSHPWAARLIRGGQSEVTLRWNDETTGLRCKARADYYVEAPARYVLDVKTCTDASPEGFAAACARYQYHLQHAHYCDGFRALGLPLASYFLLAVENEAPYVCQPYALDAAAEVAGFQLRERGAARLAECLKTDRWPGYSDDLPTLSLPAWATRNLEPNA